MGDQNSTGLEKECFNGGVEVELVTVGGNLQNQNPSNNVTMVLSKCQVVVGKC